MNDIVRNSVNAVSHAACAVVAVLIYTSNVESQSKNGVVLTKVQEAVRDIPAGTPWSQVVKGGMLKEVEIVKSDQLPGVLVADDVKANRFAGMVVGQQLYQGEQVP